MNLLRYETVVIFDSALSDSDISAQIERIDTLVKAHGGKIERQDIWGKRELAYRIAKKDYGIYVVIVFSGDKDTVADLRRQLKINDAVIRFLIVDKDNYAPDFTKQAHVDSSRENRASVIDDRVPGLDPEIEDAVV